MWTKENRRWETVTCGHKLAILGGRMKRRPGCGARKRWVCTCVWPLFAQYYCVALIVILSFLLLVIVGAFLQADASWAHKNIEHRRANARPRWKMDILDGKMGGLGCPHKVS